MKPEPTPWAAMLKLAAGLGLAPAQFWRVSLKEWRVLVAPDDSSVLPRARFDALAEQFPDKTP